MTAVASSLFAAAMFYVAALCLGLTLLRALKLELARSEERFFGFLAGSAILSLLVFGLAAAHLAYTAVFLCLGLASIALWYVRGRRMGKLRVLPPIATKWRALFWCGYATYFLVYLPIVVAPEVSPDGIGYHVGLIARDFQMHSYQWVTTSLYADFPQGIEMLFLFAYGLASGLGRQSAAAMVHFLFLLTLPFGMLSYGRRFGIPRAAVVAALLFFMTPVVGKSGPTAYNDVAVAATLFGVFYVLQVWAAERNDRLLAIAGLLAGFAFAVKYTAFLAVPFALGYVLIDLRREKARAFRAALLVTGCAAILIAPWVIKNIIVAGNPLAPFFSAYFRNPYMHVIMEREYSSVMAHHNGVVYRDIPIEACVRGLKLIGLVGPVFLLSPLALLALRNRYGRLLLLATLVFGATYFANISTRFLIPALPFLSMALAVGLDWRGISVALVIAHAVLSWPAMISLYSDPYAWRILEMPWRTAFFRQDIDRYMTRNIGDAYQMSKLIEQNVPPGADIFSMGDTLPRAYLTHYVIAGYLSSWGRKMVDPMEVALIDSASPTWRNDYKFTPHAVSRIRLALSGPGGDASWSINELRFLRNGKEVPRDPRWRLRAWPNPWDVEEAFDNNPVTRWSSWEYFNAGMYVDVDFGAPVEIDELVALSAPEKYKTPVKLEEWTSGGWRPIAADYTRSIVPAPARMRRAAIEYLKSNGLKWLVVDKGSWAFKDLVVNRIQWGITPVAHTVEHALFRLD